MKRLHLICNAHIDPVYLWDWEEGVAETLSTFRVAADFCRHYDTFIFNHNEALLYQWVKRYDQKLFEQIRSLVKEGRWHIMGGWYLQPDCNMPSIETSLRNIEEGRSFFAGEFGHCPYVAINFDPFGHSRGLVQLLKRTGYHGYLFCRPTKEFLPDLPDSFLWKGYDGSSITAVRSYDLYKSERGKATERIDEYLQLCEHEQEGLLLWGIGDHGGGPSKEDLEAIEKKVPSAQEAGIELVHSTPEAYFDTIKKRLPVVDRGINPWAAGCYTTMIRIKQRFRRLESELYVSERMASHATLTGGSISKDSLLQAQEDLLLSSFHDILPGTQAPRAEQSSLRRLDHGLELLSRVRLEAMLHLASGFPSPPEGWLSLFLYNPHPWEVTDTFCCELQLADRNTDGSWMDLELFDEQGRRIPSQVEREESEIPIDWRKRVSLHHSLPGGRLSRVLCQPVRRPDKRDPSAGKRLREQHDCLIITADEYQAMVCKKTGHLFITNGDFVVLENVGALEVFRDTSDPWGIYTPRYDRLEGSFSLLEAPVLLESAEVRSVVCCSFSYGDSKAIVTYVLDHHKKQVDLSIDCRWDQKDRMLKLPVTTGLDSPVCMAQTMGGRERYPATGEESLMQGWVALHDEQSMVAVLSDAGYGFHHTGTSLHLSVLRSPGYCAYPTDQSDSFSIDKGRERIDLGRRKLSYRILFAESEELFASIDRKACEYHERPVLQYMHSSGTAPDLLPLVLLSDQSILMTSCRLDEEGKGLLIRLFEPTGKPRSSHIEVPVLGLEGEVSLSGFQLLTLKADPERGVIKEVHLLSSGSRMPQEAQLS